MCWRLFSETADSSLSSRLTDIYAELEAIEADKAPAKAGVILSGLGFAADRQQRPTKWVVSQQLLCLLLQLDVLLAYAFLAVHMCKRWLA